ncbi:hypothetical protein [Clostridium tagluense]|uniref:hypothetical protein n=1 Tax=Clostridium tagluense TaxID=360422 RepID=UPI001CF4DD60|nr:hypothetical protein [Clostridium tagluense]MCB2300420.1 hypothetical protein [Clostridium tagluense]
MINENILKLAGELITLEQLQEIEENEAVESVENNGLSGNNPHYGKTWYSVKFNETFIAENCDDVSEIQVYTD